MRILHTIPSLHPSTGGPARSVPCLANALGKQNLEVHVWSPEIPANFPETSGFVLHRGSLDAAMENMGKPDVIHDHGVWLPINHRIAKVARERGIPRIVSPRGMLEPWALNHKKWKKKLAWWLYQRADLNTAAALHATANSEAKQFERLGLRQPIYVIPNGVDISSPSSSNQLSTSSLKTALFLSRIHPKKGLPMLVEAWAQVRPQGWRMRIVGPDEAGHRSEIEDLVAKASLTETWTFEGAFDDEAKWECFRDADLFILPTYSENFGIAVAEALASGVPVITTTGTPWQGLTDTKSGWWVEPTAIALADALQDACTRESSDLREMGSRGREWMLREFTWKSVASRMTRAYNELLFRT